MHFARNFMKDSFYDIKTQRGKNNVCKTYSVVSVNLVSSTTCAGSSAFLGLITGSTRFVSRVLWKIYESDILWAYISCFFSCPFASITPLSAAYLTIIMPLYLFGISERTGKLLIIKVAVYIMFFPLKRSRLSRRRRFLHRFLLLFTL